MPANATSGGLTDSGGAPYGRPPQLTLEVDSGDLLAAHVRGSWEMTIESGCPMSRRRLFGVLGAGAASTVAAGAFAPAQARATINTAVRPDRFGRLFDDLEPFAEA